MCSAKISYQIFFSLYRSVELQVGKLGKFIFPKGNYVYTGSAKNNIDQRIQRHQIKNKKLHWHIDYILNREECKIQKIIKSDLDECMLNKTTSGKIIIPGFGASDCIDGCISHLKFFA